MVDTKLTRRTFLKTSGALGALAVAGGGAVAADSLFGAAVPQALAEDEQVLVGDGVLPLVAIGHRDPSFRDIFTVQDGSELFLNEFFMTISVKQCSIVS